MKKNKRFDNIIEPIVKVKGFEYVGCDFVPQGRKFLLRIYIEGCNGITADDCAVVSREISTVLDVEDPIAGAYQLEVSSPGIERPLFTVEHFQRFLGRKVRIKMVVPQNEQRNFKGLLKEADDSKIILIDEKDVEIALPFAEIEKANLVMDFDMGHKR